MAYQQRFFKASNTNGGESANLKFKSKLILVESKPTHNLDWLLIHVFNSFCN